ncbi:MAG: RNA ligase family protein [Candidatus Heimdallarchaeaceae archaeon]
MIKYPSIERLGHPDNLEILAHDEDTVVVEEKVDGGNGSFWLDDDGTIHVASRNRDLTAEGDTKTFAKQRETLMKILEGKKLNLDYYYYVEWMAPHTIRYTSAPDVIGIDIRLKRNINNTGPGLFLGRDLREQEFNRLGIENVPVVWRGKVRDLKKMKIHDLIPKSKYYDGKAEGIVIKNYCRKARFGNHQLYAKVVTEEFRENNKAIFGGIRQKTTDTAKIVERFITDARIKKIVLKQVHEYNRPLDMSLMSVVPVEVIKDMLKEEISTIFDEYRLIDFKEMKKIVAKKCLVVIRELMEAQAFLE